MKIQKRKKNRNFLIYFDDETNKTDKNAEKNKKILI